MFFLAALNATKTGRLRIQRQVRQLALVPNITIFDHVAFFVQTTRSHAFLLANFIEFVVRTSELYCKQYTHPITMLQLKSFYTILQDDRCEEQVIVFRISVDFL